MQGPRPHPHPLPFSRGSSRHNPVAFMSANRHRGMWLARRVVATASNGLARGMCGGPRRCDGDGQRHSSSTLALSFHHTVVHYQHGSRLAAVHSRRATPSPSQPAAPQCSERRVRKEEVGHKQSPLKGIVELRCKQPPQCPQRPNSTEEGGRQGADTLPYQDGCQGTRVPTFDPSGNP